MRKRTRAGGPRRAGLLVCQPLPKSMASKQAALNLNAEEAPLGADERRGKARTSWAVLLSIAALLIVVGSVASLSETTEGPPAASTDLADVTTALRARHAFPDSFRIVSQMSANEMKAKRMGKQGEHVVGGRRLLAGPHIHRAKHHHTLRTSHHR